MMVALLFYAYSIGVRSARWIERRGAEDVAFRVTTANQVRGGNHEVRAVDLQLARTP
jgi:hypothetical protein